MKGSNPYLTLVAIERNVISSLAKWSSPYLKIPALERIDLLPRERSSPYLSLPDLEKQDILDPVPNHP